jgi:NAD-dependent DNA ligase
MQVLSRTQQCDLQAVQGIADKSAEQIHSWFANKDNLRLMTELCAIWNLPGTGGNVPDTQVNPQETHAASQPKETSWSLDLGNVVLAAGDSIVVTGAFDGVRRADLQAWCVLLGLPLALGTYSPLSRIRILPFL